MPTMLFFLKSLMTIFLKKVAKKSFNMDNTEYTPNDLRMSLILLSRGFTYVFDQDSTMVIDFFFQT